MNPLSIGNALEAFRFSYDQNKQCTEIDCKHPMSECDQDPTDL